MKRILHPIASLMLLVLCAGSVQAATLYWDRNGSTAGASSSPNGQWSTTSGQFNTTASGIGASGADILSWSPTTGSADTAYFAAGSDAVTAYNVTVNGAVSVAGITFGYGGPATLLDAGGSISFDAAAVSIVNTVNGTITALLAGTGTVTKSGAGILTLGNTGNTYSGDLTITEGALSIATINNVSANGVLGNNANAVTLGGSGTTGQLTITGAGLSSDKPFAMAAGGAGVIDVGANNLTLTGVFSGSGNFTKNGTGTLILGTANNSGLSGATSISAGGLDVTTGGSLAGSAVTVGSAGKLAVVYGAADSTWTNSALTYNANTSVQNIDFLAATPSATVAPIQVAGALTFTAGNATFNIAGSALTDGTYPLFKYGSESGGAYPMAVSSMPGTMIGTISNNVGQLTLWLRVVTPPAGKHWATGDGVWEIGGSTPWSGATSYAEGDVVQFLDLDATGNPTVTLNTTVNPLSVLVSNNVASYTITGSGAISGAVIVTKKDPGTLTLNLANTYTGGTILNAGTLNIKNAAALGGGTSPFTLNGGTFDNTSGGPLTTLSYIQNWGGDFTFTGTADLNLGSGAVTLVGGTRTATVSASKLTVGGAIGGASGFGLSKAGSGTLTLGGANSYDGDTRIVGGTLVVANSSGLPFSILDMATADTGTLAFSSGLGTATFANLKGTRAISLQDESSAAVALTVGGGGSGNQTYNGSISGVGSLTKAGSYILALQNTGQTWTHSGGTTVGAGGTLQLGLSINLASGPLTVNGLVQNEGRAITVNGLSGTGTLGSSSTFDNCNWIVGSGDASSTFTGQIIKPPAKNNSLKKVGTGTLTLSGASSIGTVDGTRIEAGRVVAKNTGSLGSFKCTVAGAGAATLEMNSTANVTWDGTMSLILSNSATLVSSGGFLIRYSKSGFPSIDLASGSAVTIGTVASGDTLEFGSAVTDGSATSVINVNGAGTNRLASGSTTGYAGNWAIANGTLQLHDANSLGNNTGPHTVTMTGGVLEPRVSAGATYAAANVVVNGNAAIVPNRITVGTGVIQTFGTLEIGANTLTVTAGNNADSGREELTFAGATTLSGDAIFTVNNGAAAGTRVNLGGVGESGGARKLTKNGTGILALGGAGAFTGGVTLSAGQLNINHATALGTAAGTFTINGASTIINNSGGALTLTANNPQAWDADFTFGFTGPGNDDLNLGTGAVTLSASRQVTVADDVLTVGGIISGSGFGLAKDGGGTLALNGVNAYTGATTVSGGTLRVNAPGSLAAGSAVSVASGATLGGNGTVNGAVTVSAGGILSPGASIGTLTLTVAPSLDSASTNVFEINKAAGPVLTSDKLVVSGGGGALALNGTLIVTATGDALTAGDAFDLFDDPDGISGSFATNLPALNPGLAWDISQLAVNGTISVVSVCIPATVNAGLDQTVCASSPVVTLAGTFTGATNATWSGGAGGVFTPNNTTTNATYTPTGAEITAGTVTLTLTTDAGDTCGSVNDSMTITINPAATVDASSDQTICADAAATLAGGFGGVATNATWASSGDGSFGNNTVTNTTYTPGTADKAAGTVTLTLTTGDPNGPCPAVNDSMILTINALTAITNQPASQAVCVGSPAIFNVGAAGTTLAYQWQVSGDGGATFTNISVTATNASYTNLSTTVADNGSQYQVIVAGACGPSVTSAPPAVLTVNIPATVDAGPDQTVCASSPVVTLAGSFAVATNATWSGGAGSFGPNNTTTNATYTPTGGEISAGTVTLTLTTDDPAGPCGAVNDSLTITILNPVTITSIGGTSIAYTGGTGAQFVLLNSTNVTAPLSGWSREATNTVTPGTFTIPAVGTGPATLFYNIKTE